MGMFDMFKGFFHKKPFQGEIRKCPNCKEKIDLGWERCPKCGVHISSIFKKKCPECKALNDLNATLCKKCEYNFLAEMERAKKKAYRCPICGYEASYFMMKCPVCGTRFG